MKSSDEVLRYWFGGEDTEPFARSDLWWGQVDDQEAVDRRIDEEFGDLVEAALDGEFESWREEPRSCVAYVLVVDQFPRHIYRGTARVYVGDERALAAAQGAWERDYHEELSLPEQIFVSMPLMHSEDLEIQHRAVEVFEWIVDHAPAELREMAETTLEHAREHCEIVERFGRFPHRNPLLGREHTPEERAYLEETGNWYGQRPD